MNDKPAAMAGVYVDMKFMPGLKMARISIEIPIEHSNAFIQMFGTPDRASPVPVAIARLSAASVPERAEPAAPVVKAETGAVEPKRERKLSEIAALRCKDIEFQMWLKEKHPLRWPEPSVNFETSGVVADRALKLILGLASKTELDQDGPKAERFKQMLTDYDYRNQVRA